MVIITICLKNYTGLINHQKQPW